MSPIGGCITARKHVQGTCQKLRYPKDSMSALGRDLIFGLLRKARKLDRLLDIESLNPQRELCKFRRFLPLGKRTGDFGDQTFTENLITVIRK
eukprot:1349816-Amorphochlora_amoeboformis.AAC.1